MATVSMTACRARSHRGNGQVGQGSPCLADAVKAGGVAIGLSRSEWVGATWVASFLALDLRCRADHSRRQDRLGAPRGGAGLTATPVPAPLTATLPTAAAFPMLGSGLWRLISLVWTVYAFVVLANFSPPNFVIIYASTYPNPECEKISSRQDSRLDLLMSRGIGYVLYAGR